MKSKYLHTFTLLFITVVFCFAELPEKTLSNLKQAAESDDPKAQFYLYCLNKETNKELAEIWLRKSATNNYAEAQNTLGLLIDEQNNNQSPEAYTWYLRAANQDHAYAQYNLGLCYLFGSGTDKKIEEAALWLEKAAQQGHVPAQYNIGLMYQNGDGIQKDISKAIFWWEKAASQNDMNAQVALGDISCRKDSSSFAPERAFKYYLMAANQGSSHAQYKLGVAYYFGSGISKNLDESARWFETAKAQGHERASESLKKLKSSSEYKNLIKERQERIKAMVFWSTVCVLAIFISVVIVSIIKTLMKKKDAIVQAQKEAEQNTTPSESQSTVSKSENSWSTISKSQIGIAIVFLIAILDLPYNAYILMHWIVCPAMLYFAFIAYKRSFLPLVWIFGILGGIYNPLFSVPFSKELWVVLNSISVLALCYGVTKAREAKPFPSMIWPIVLIVIFGFISTNQRYLDFDDIFDPPRKSRRR